MSDVSLSPALAAAADAGRAALQKLAERDEAIARAIFDDVVRELTSTTATMKRIMAHDSPVNRMVYAMLMRAGIHVTRVLVDGVHPAWECRRYAPEVDDAVRAANERTEGLRAVVVRTATSDFCSIAGALSRSRSMVFSPSSDGDVVALVYDMVKRAGYTVVYDHLQQCPANKGSPCNCRASWVVSR